MPGYKDDLCVRAEMLEDTGDLAGIVTAILDGASGAGVDPDAVTGLRSAIRALDPAGAPPGYQAGSAGDRHRGSGYRSDADFLEAVSNAENKTWDRLREVADLQEVVAEALTEAEAGLREARAALNDARQALSYAYALPTREECDGCHGRKAAAIKIAAVAVAVAEECISDALRRISACDAAAGILDPLAGRLEAALQALRQVPQDLGETYSLVYAFIRGGGKLPTLARWIEGAPA